MGEKSVQGSDRASQACLSIILPPTIVVEIQLNDVQYNSKRIDSYQSNADLILQESP